MGRLGTFRIGALGGLILGLMGLGVMGIGCTKPSRDPLVVIGLDGADFDLLLPWLEAGELPHLQSFLEESSLGELTTVFPILSPVCWTSATTGVNPGKHGIYDFQKADPDDPTGPPILEQATNRRAAPVWTLLSDLGYKVGVLNVPMTYPPDPIRGAMVSGFPYPQGDLEFTYPLDLQGSLGDFPLDSLGASLDVMGPEKMLAEIQEALAVRGKLAQEWIASGNYDFMWVVFTASDKVQHFFWRYMDPNHPNHDPEIAATYGNAILEVWKQLDAILGELLAALPVEARVVLLSDHGFEAIYRQVNLASCLEAEHLTEWLRDYAVPPLHVTNGILHYKVKGQVVGASDREMALDRITEIMENLRDPEWDRAPVEKVLRREDLYRGATLEKAPDLVFYETPHYFFISRVKQGLELPPIFEDLNATSFSAYHRPEGVFAMRGPGIVPGSKGRSLQERILSGGDFDGAQILDVAPTLLALLGEAIPEQMDGRVLTRGITPEFLSAHPLRIEPIPGFLFDREPPKLSKTEKEALKSIPYIQ